MGRIERVLIVEDDAVLAMALADAFADAGAGDIKVAPSIAEAMEALRDMRPEALVLDVNLADRDDGWTLAELAVHLCPERPAIIFSTGSPEAVPAEVAELGTVLAKPYSPDDLLAAVARIRSGETLLGRLRRLID